MAKSEFAQAYTERMFPDIASPAGYIDPEFEDLFENFAFHEVIIEDGCNVAAHSRFLAILATLVGAGATDEYSLMMPAALNFGVIPDEIVELIYQAVPYLGIGKVRPFFKITNKILITGMKKFKTLIVAQSLAKIALKRALKSKWKSGAKGCGTFTNQDLKIRVTLINGYPTCLVITIRVRALVPNNVSLLHSVSSWPKEAVKRSSRRMSLVI